MTLCRAPFAIAPFAIAPFVIAPFVIALFASPAVAQMQRVALDQRFYLIDLPDTPSGALILALHGAGGSPASFAKVSGLADAALPLGYTVIFPAGVEEDGRRTWNALYCCGEAQAAGVDDLAFLDRVVADAADRFGLDPGRLYLTGMSNGAMLAETYGVLRGVKAVAGVSGTLDLTQAPAAAVPLLHIHGRADQVVPYDGGQGRNATADFTPVDDVIAAFVAAFGDLTRAEGTIDIGKGGTLDQRVDYADATGTVQVRLISIEDGGHTWPGGDSRGRTGAGQVSATGAILDFFALHP